MTTPYRSPDAPPGLRPFVSSGKTPVLGVVGGVLAGTLAALVLSVVYAYGTIYIPIVQVEFLLTVIFGAAVGASTAGVMHQQKVRSRTIVIATAFVLGVFAWAFSWLPWLYGTFQRFEIPITVGEVFDPLFLGGAISRVYETGTWSVGSTGSSGSAVSGAMLGFVWLCEAATIIGFSTFVAVAQSKDKVFCEACGSWCTVMPDRAVYALDAGPALRAALVERAELSALESAPRPAAVDRWLSLKIGFCAGCGETNVIGLDEVKQTVDRKGNAQRSNKAYLPFHCLTRGEMTELRSKLRV
ncbi:MAG: hypothetical protein K1X94_11895 [Sandaracinaceae bacterium]|nr:hypothetical protein [Sandaracinaceae bacterium]